MRKYWIWIIIALGICGVLWFALNLDMGKKKKFVFKLPRRRQIYPPEEEQSLQKLLAGMERSIEILGDKMQKEAELKRWLMVNLHECINRIADEDEPFESTRPAFIYPLKGVVTRGRGMGLSPVGGEVIAESDVKLDIEPDVEPNAELEAELDAEPNMASEKREEVTSLERKARMLICRLNLMSWSLAMRSYMADASIEHLKGRLASIDPNHP